MTISTQLAGCLLTNDHGHVLLLHRNTPRLTQWELPGGKVEPGESYAEAAIRENREEIAVDVSVISEIGKTHFFHDNINWEYHWFRATIIAGIPTINEPGRYDGLEYIDLLDAALIARIGVSVNIEALIAALNKKDISL